MDNILSNFKIELVARIIKAISGTLLTVYLARSLGPNDYGLFSLLLSILAVVLVFSRLGLGQSAARYITDYKEESPHQLAHIINISLYYLSLLIIVVSVIIYFISGSLGEILGEPEISHLLLLGPIYIASRSIFEYLRNLFQGFENMIITGKLQVIESVIRMGLTIGFVTLGFGLLGAFFGYFAGYFISSIFGMIVLYVSYYSKYDRDIKPISGLKSDILRYSLPITLTRSAAMIDQRVDILLLGYFTNPIQVSFYTISKQIVGFIEIPASTLGFTTGPSYNVNKTQGNEKKAASIFEKSFFHILFLYIPAGSGLVLVAEPTIQYILGEEYLGAVSVLQLFAIYTILYSVVHTTSNGLDYLGRAKERATVKTVASITNLFLNIVLIPMLGAIGACLSLIVSEFIYSSSNLYIMHKEIKFGYLKLFRNSLKIILPNTIMVAFLIVFKDYVGGILTLILLILSGIVVYTSLSIVAGLIDVKEAREMLKNPE